jgi:hypothetical protein
VTNANTGIFIVLGWATCMLPIFHATQWVLAPPSDGKATFVELVSNGTVVE